MIDDEDLDDDEEEEVVSKPQRSPVKRKIENEDIEKVFGASMTQIVVSDEQKKLLYKIIVDSVKRREHPQIKLDELMKF